MRSIKTSGGLTRGRGMTELQRAVWFLSIPSCGEVSNAMQRITGINYEFSKQQHKESRQSRKERDYKDALAVMIYVLPRNPFSDKMELINIYTGEVAEKNVNAENALLTGNTIVKSMKGNMVSNYTFQKKEQAVVMKSNSVIEIDNDLVVVDPQLLFQQLLASVQGMGVDVYLETAFGYELCTFPTSLIASDGLIRQADKPKLAAAIPTNNVHYVIDGGSLLHRIKWNKVMFY